MMKLDEIEIKKQISDLMPYHQGEMVSIAICFNPNQHHELFIGMFNSFTKETLKKLFF